MLKQIQMVGFKSFADKTEFTFSPGVTGIVGPNGSGKSNIVDAVRWVLGEQSAKSLRGGEMTDVIFNGSASRRSLGLAEVTMVFDNSHRVLATDADEVQITRRVYRSGEGEYLINHQPCRLKDIKDLFLGSGAGHDAYCIIEQGRVDVLLQASTRERRTIFEEAAGISRFKAKKTETLRKLERVDQNVQRLRDILEEVEKQLRSVKLQAAKAQRYQEYSERLKHLRVGLCLEEYRHLGGKLEAETEVLEALKRALQEQMTQASAWEIELQQMEEALTGLGTSIRAVEGELEAAHLQIVAGEATLAHEWTSADDIDRDLAQTRLQTAGLMRHVAALAEALDRAMTELESAEEQCTGQRRRVRELTGSLHQAEQELAELQEQVDHGKAGHMEAMRQMARMQNETISHKAQLDTLVKSRDRLRQRSEQAAEHLASVDLQLQELAAGEESLQGRLGSARQGLQDLRQERERYRLLTEDTAQQAADLRTQRSGLASRIEVLEGLERSHEGLGTGPREVFALLQQPNPGPWRTVIGMVADFLTVRRNFAPVIDVALGEHSQRFLVQDADLLTQALVKHGKALAGRVSFLPLSIPAPVAEPVSASTAVMPEGIPGYPGVVALAERVVRCDDPRLTDLPRRLLGRTLIVRDLASARACAAQMPGWRCVTMQGELLEPDGTLTVGTHHAETGILSRKSELRELRDQVETLDLSLTQLDGQLLDLRERTAVLDGGLENQQLEIDVLTEQLADMRARIGQHQQRRDGLHEEVQVNRSEISGLEQEIENVQSSWQRAQEEASAAEARVQELQTQIQDAERAIRRHEGQRQQQQQDALAAKVALAQVEERLTGLQARHEQLQEDLRQREQELQQRRQHLAAGEARLDECQRTLLSTYASLAGQALDKEQAERRLAEELARRDDLSRRRQEVMEQTQASRTSWHSQQEQAHARELEVNDLRHRLQALCSRLQEDYQLDLAALYQQRLAEGWPEEPVPEAPTETEGEAPPAVADPEEEIAELKRKLSRLGHVNMEALQELNDLDARASTLQIQFDDLSSAQKTLQDIINRINGDSRRLFTETFQTIRGHFQELFRKLFGGGMADIVLEDETDVLECGIEVIARPPGKELRSISLMSGGEKTMTAVALLLAIFRSKPSPFCILDEVDAALDEANIGRFTAVLKDFLERSQFIIVTHSKRTMACADVLYGVTMAESGISRRMSVRFEDWPEDGVPAEQAG
jgi:chromosome segregation protein